MINHNYTDMLDISTLRGLLDLSKPVPVDQLFSESYISASKILVAGLFWAGKGLLLNSSGQGIAGRTFVPS